MITRTGIADTQSPKFAGHETFSLRYGWPKKAVDATAADPLVFTRDEAVIALGVGKNMVRSIRHWGLMTGILEEAPEQPNNRGRHIRPSALGALVFAAKGRIGRSKWGAGFRESVESPLAVFARVTTDSLSKRP